MILRRLERKDPRPAFTLMEMMVVMAIIVLLAGLGGWVYMHQLESAREKTALATLQHLTTLLDTYKTDMGEYPESLDVLTQPQDGKPAYIEAKDLNDPWGQRYVYEPQNRNPQTFRPRIYSTHQTGGQQIANW